MTSLVQWRQFSFFSQETVEYTETLESQHLARFLRALDVLCVNHGRGWILLGDSLGFVHLVDRQLLVSSFPAYEKSVLHIKQLRQRNILLTVGFDSDPFPVLKVWNLDKTDSQKNPLLVRSVKIQYGGQPYPVTSLAVMESMAYLALGLANGVVLLIKGDLSRERFTKQRTLCEQRVGQGAITGLAFANAAQIVAEPGRVLLYVVTESNTIGYHLIPNVKETCEFTDDLGAAAQCSVLNDRQEMVLAREEAVYLYRGEGRGPCYVLAGSKRASWWFRSYWVVCTQETTGRFVLQIFDLTNKLIAYSLPLDSDVLGVAYEWGHLYVLTKGRFIYRLTEKDLLDKLELLFKKNLYSLALNLGRAQEMDASGIADLYKRYGDHLFAKGEHDSALEQYRNTIGQLEPSYVIRKFLDAQRIDNLTSYLESLHERGLATAEHTTLLLNCYTKSRDLQRLDEFIRAERQVSFDVETAIKVCRSAGFYKHAVYLARRCEEHETFLRIQIEDLKDFKEALEYVKQLPSFEVKRLVKKYGKQLVGHLPKETASLLISLCFDRVENESDSDYLKQMRDQDRCAPDDFVHLFVDCKNELIDFLEESISKNPKTSSTVVWNTLLELYLAQDQKLEDKKEDRVMKLLKDPKANYDMDHALVLCQSSQNYSGIVYLYEKLNRLQDLIQFYMDKGEFANVLSTCKRHGEKDTTLWVRVLSFFADQKDCREELTEVLAYIDNRNLIPPLRVIQILSKNESLPLEVIKGFVVHRIRLQKAAIDTDKKLIASYKEETEKLKQEIEEMNATTKVFQVTRCTACSAPLDLPAIHFLCKHSYHIRCMGQNEDECPQCAPEFKLMEEMKKSLEANASQHDQFFRELEGADDGFSVVADYFSRNTFSALT